MSILLCSLFCLFFGVVDVCSGFVFCMVSLLFFFVVGGKFVVFSEFLCCDSLSLSLIILSVWVFFFRLLGSFVDL